MDVSGDIRYLVDPSPPPYWTPIFVRCPNHSDKRRPNFAVYPNGAHCFACGYDESPDAFTLRLGLTLEDLQDLPRQPDRGDRTARSSHGSFRRSYESQVELSQTCYFYHRFLTDVVTAKQAYLVDRCILPRTIRDYQLGYTGSWFSIPIWYGTELRGLKLRSDEAVRGKTYPKYKNAKRTLTTLFRPNPRGRQLVIVEGEFDALVVAQYGYDAITTSTGAGSLDELVWLKHTRKEVFIAVDQDEDGERAARTLGDMFPNSRRVRFEGKDVTTALQAIPSMKRKDALSTWIRMS